MDWARSGVPLAEGGGDGARCLLGVIETRFGFGLLPGASGRVLCRLRGGGGELGRLRDGVLVGRLPAAGSTTPTVSSGATC